MKNILLLCIAVIGLLSGCNENDRMVWETQAGVYFPEFSEKSDSSMYSFRISRAERDTINIKVKLLGALLSKPAAFSIVVETSSTAIAGTHYEALKDSYTFPAGDTITYVPICVLKKGSELDNKIVSLNFRLEATADLNVAYSNKAHGRLLITNQLIKPAYWDDEYLEFYFSDYSQVKHLKIIELMGHDFPLTAKELADYGGISGYTYWMLAGRELCNYYIQHPNEYDENNNLISPWEPL